ncbi:MAG: histidine--tRNA ligase [Deltaproteobacteria bacterium]|nr:histidine--tRNA ligase [Deltaproteobacteria bacterium]
MTTQAIKGMRDILPPESNVWSAVEALARKIFTTYGFREIRTPLCESTALFERGVGKTSSLVQKQMYSFEDKKGVSLTLRPEGTAPVVRAFVNSGLAATNPVAKFFYISPMFRYEAPQKGRSRQFHQIGVEFLGTVSPMADAEILIMLFQFFRALKLKNLQLEINSLGCKNCKPEYNKALKTFLKGKEKKLCEECHDRAERNPLRILDCKKEGCKELIAQAPLVSEYWCEECRQHFREVGGLLLAGGVAYKENPKIVRGLDYYSRTAFEVLSTDLGAQDALMGGGRYDGLVKDLGGPDVPGVGFAVGMERLLLLLPEEFVAAAEKAQGTKIFFALLGPEAQRKALSIIQELRNLEKEVEIGYGGSLKSQMRRADKLQASHVIILGDQEVERGIAIVKNMKDGTQQEILLGRLVEKLCTHS